jgi:hypothetical protein
MTTPYTQNELAAMETNLDRDTAALKAEILELTVELGTLATKAYSGTYQDDLKLRSVLWNRLTDIMDGLKMLSDSAGNLIVAGGSHEHE